MEKFNNKINISIIITVAILAIVGCSNKKTEIGRTSDGKLMYEVDLVDGIRNGEIIEYHPDGLTKLVGSYKSGELHGLCYEYYQDGTLQTLSNWDLGVRTGTFEYYYPNGAIKERKIYNDLGEVIYFTIYGVDGEKQIETAVPFLRSECDTVKLGDSVRLKITFGIPMKGIMKVSSGEYIQVDSSDVYFKPKESLAPIMANTFSYSSKAYELGIKTVGFSFNYEESEFNDTLDLAELIMPYTFYVVETSADPS